VTVTLALSTAATARHLRHHASAKRHGISRLANRKRRIRQVAPETKEEHGFWQTASPWVHGALGIAKLRARFIRDHRVALDAAILCWRRRHNSTQDYRLPA